MSKLTINNHSRIFANLTYVYPVVSRRSGGVSLGINLNINNACNWRCIYCQVDGLIRGNPVEINLIKLEQELDYMINWIINDDFISKYAPIELSRFNDICISGNGESTLSKQFLPTVELIVKLRNKYSIDNEVKTVLITNGSELDRNDIQKSLKILATINGEVWFKVDSATSLGINSINQVAISIEKIKKKLILSSSLCKTYIQTCMFQINNQNPSPSEIAKYVEFVTSVKDHIAGILLYSVARNPALPEGQKISSVDKKFLSYLTTLLDKVHVQFYE